MQDSSVNVRRARIDILACNAVQAEDADCIAQMLNGIIGVCT